MNSPLSQSIGHEDVKRRLAQSALASHWRRGGGGAASSDEEEEVEEDEGAANVKRAERVCQIRDRLQQEVEIEALELLLERF